MQALAASLVVVAAGLQAQKAPRDMDRFIDQLMKKMTLEEKIGQLNLPDDRRDHYRTGEKQRCSQTNP